MFLSYFFLIFSTSDKSSKQLFLIVCLLGVFRPMHSRIFRSYGDVQLSTETMWYVFYTECSDIVFGRIGGEVGKSVRPASGRFSVRIPAATDPETSKQVMRLLC